MDPQRDLHSAQNPGVLTTDNFTLLISITRPHRAAFETALCGELQQTGGAGSHFH
jgi:hypothetical protein